jgi:GAF domain-containing protein
MAETLHIPQNATRKEIYETILPQIKALLDGEPDLIANMANISAVLREAFGFFWVGFYIKRENQLVLGPFQGPIACTRINFDRGVCGYTYRIKKTVIVPNVDNFPGHIACSSASKSEIVVPVFDKNREVMAVLDVDSDKLADFSEDDKMGLEAIIRLLEETL